MTSPAGHCCPSSGQPKDAGADTCPMCQCPAVAIDPITPRALLTASALRRGVPPRIRSCSTPDCEVVYFARDPDLLWKEEDLRVAVYSKHPTGPERIVCYCFDITTAEIRTGAERVSRMITAEIQAGHCACELRNPKGSCCLGDVRELERQSRAENDWL